MGISTPSPTPSPSLGHRPKWPHIVPQLFSGLLSPSLGCQPRKGRTRPVLLTVEAPGPRAEPGAWQILTVRQATATAFLFTSFLTPPLAVEPSAHPQTCRQHSSRSSGGRGEAGRSRGREDFTSRSLRAPRAPRLRLFPSDVAGRGDAGHGLPDQTPPRWHPGSGTYDLGQVTYRRGLGFLTCKMGRGLPEEVEVT